MNLNAANLDSDSPSQMEFCTLEYRPQSWKIDSPGAASVVLLVLRDQKGCLHIRAHPKVGTVVGSEDLPLIRSLLLDFTERAKLHPAALFKQLCSLNVGPLVTHAVGSSLSNHPLLQKCFLKFEELN
jgi:hypothetical protein